jgi:hypothetical protein
MASSSSTGGAGPLTVALAEMAWSALIPEEQWTCEGQNWNGHAWFAGAASMLAATGFLVTTLYYLWKTRNEKFPVTTTCVAFLLFAFNSAQAAALTGHWWIAQGIQYLALSMAYLSLYDVLTRWLTNDRSLNLMCMFTTRIYWLVTIVGLVTLGLSYNPATIALALIPPGILFFLMLFWICMPPHFRKINSKTITVAWFLSVRLIFAAVAFVLWSLDFWLCNDSTRYVLYGFSVLIFAWVSHEINIFFGYIDALNSGNSEVMFTNFILSSLSVPNKGTASSGDKDKDSDTETQDDDLSSVRVTVTASTDAKAVGFNMGT